MPATATATARRYVFGRREDVYHPDTMRACLAEFLSTFIFAFAGEGSVLALHKIINISGGHLNPAVTFAALVGGRISALLAFFYWIAQLLAAVFATLLLRFATGGMRPRGFFVASGVGELHGLVLEIVLTFGLVYTFYATVIDPKRGSLGIIAPLAIGLICVKKDLEMKIILQCYIVYNLYFIIDKFLRKVK
ncbi:hypothetical protein ACFE04_003108 [Oxalis oulophora]